jgi:hypothetical protein
MAARRSGRAGAALVRRVVVVSTVVALSTGAAACDGSNSSRTGANQDRIEMRFRPPPPGYTETKQLPHAAHALVCPDAKPVCEKPSAVAVAQWAAGESYFTVFTANGRPTADVPAPDDFFSRHEDGNAQHVTVRGHPGVLWLADAADFELLWRERPGVWVRMAAEDVTHAKAEILGYARDLEPVPWSAPRGA